MFRRISKWRVKKKILAVGVLLLIGGVVVWKTKSASPAVTYQTAEATRKTLVVSIASSGQVTSKNSAVVTTQASGVVKHVYVHDGQTVKQGTVLAEIELDTNGVQKYNQMYASYLSAKNGLESAKTSAYTLQASLFSANQKFINDAVARDLDSTDPTFIQENATWLAAEATYKNQQNVVAQSEAGVRSNWLSFAAYSPTITAPIAGTVSGLSLTEGEVVGSADAATTVASIKTQARPTIKLNLSEIDAPKVHVGDSATITLDALLGKSYVGKVISVDTTGSVTSGVTTYPVVVALADEVADIFPNMAATVHIILQTKNDALVVPTAAVTTANGQTTVRVMRNGQPQSVNVETGLVSDSEVEITSGLAEGDTVVTSVTSSAQRSTTSGQSVFSSFGGTRTGFGGAAGQQVRIAR